MTSDYFVRPATPPESRLLEERFPAMRVAGAVSLVFVAPDRAGIGPPLGFAVLQTPDGSSGGKGVAHVHVFVRPDHRRKGIGSALLRQAIGTASGMGLRTLETLKPLEPKDPARVFLERSSFESVSVANEFEADAAAMLAVVEPVHRHLLERGKIPPSAELVPIQDAPVSEVRDLVTQHLPRLEGDLEPDLHSFAGTSSRALRVDGRVIGAMLEKSIGDIVFIYAIAVAPQRRNTWASTYLKQALFSSLVARGVKRVRFRANDVIHRDTVKWAQKAHADVRARMEHFHLELAGKDQQAQG